MSQPQLIVALDLPTLKEAERFVRLLKPAVSWFKIGLRLFTVAGPDAVKMVREAGAKVFLDLKFHDIPNTVAQACELAVALGVSMLDVHATGGGEMLEAAAKAVNKKTILVGVTVLTSQGGDSEERVVELATLCKESGLDGVVCSAQEAAAVRKSCGKDFLIVTPGIRPASYGTQDDQKQIATPLHAIKNGSDYLVVGRPILEAQDPVGAAREILSEVR